METVTPVLKFDPRWKNQELLFFPKQVHPSTHGTRRLADTVEKASVYCAVRTGFVNEMDDLTFAIPKFLNYRNKIKDHNGQTQQYFVVFLK